MKMEFTSSEKHELASRSTSALGMCLSLFAIPVPGGRGCQRGAAPSAQQRWVPVLFPGSTARAALLTGTIVQGS